MTDEVADLLREVLYHTMHAEMAAMRAERLLGLDDTKPPGELDTAGAWDNIALSLSSPSAAYALTPEQLAEAFRLPWGAF